MAVAFETSKRIDESWREYVQRLVERDYIDEEDQQKWLEGRSGKWTRKILVTTFDVSLRVRHLEKNNRQIEQVFGVQVPVANYVKGTLLLPKLGTLTNETEFDGFIDSNGERIATLGAKLTKTEFRRRERELKKQTATNILNRAKNESPSNFIGRLVSEGIMTASQQKRWQTGLLESIKVKEPQTVIISRNQIRNGREVTIEVPVRRTKTIEVSLPSPKKQTTAARKKK